MCTWTRGTSWRACQASAVWSDGNVQQQLGAIHQTLHQCLCFGQWDATFEMHRVHLLEESLPVVCT